MISSKSRHRLGLAAKRAKALGLSQAQIAVSVGASQSQVSRVLAGLSIKRSKLVDAVCDYVFSVEGDVSADRVRDNQELIAALAATWDGTPVHSTALATVIRSLGFLHPSQPEQSVVDRR